MPDRSASPLSHESQMRVWTRYQAMGTVAFWSITVAFLLALGGQIAYLVHQMSFLSQYIGPQGAALAISMTAGASIVGRQFFGNVCHFVCQTSQTNLSFRFPRKTPGHEL